MPEDAFNTPSPMAMKLRGGFLESMATQCPRANPAILQGRLTFLPPSRND